MLLLNNLYVKIDNLSIIKGLSLKIGCGEIHVIMGPNGSGKSTLSFTLAGKENYKVVSGSIIFKGNNLLSMTPEDRAKNGIFISFQHPPEIPGVSNECFLQSAVQEIREYRNVPFLGNIGFKKFIYKKLRLLHLSEDVLHRFINVGFSGGEKKRNEVLQMIVLEPCLSVLDEIDSGLDIDSLQLVSKVINSFYNKERSFIIITHYNRILKYIHPDYVHILNQGCIVKSGDSSLAKDVEEHGYEYIID